MEQYTKKLATIDQRNVILGQISSWTDVTEHQRTIILEIMDTVFSNIMEYSGYHYFPLSTLLDLNMRVAKITVLELGKIVGIQPIKKFTDSIRRLEYKFEDYNCEILGGNVESKTISLEFRKHDVWSRTVNLSLSLTQEAVHDLGGYFALDMPDFIAKKIAEELISDVVLTLCHAYNRSIFDIIELNDLVIKNEHSNLLCILNRALNNVAIKSRRGFANYMVVEPKFVENLEKLDNYFIPSDEPIVDDEGWKLQYRGTYRHSVKVYSYKHLEFSHKILCGYKSDGEIDTGFIYSHHIPVEFYGYIKNPFIPGQSVATFKSRRGFFMNCDNYHNVLDVVKPSINLPEVETVKTSFGDMF